MSTITISKTIKCNLERHKSDSDSLDKFINDLLNDVEDDLKLVPVIDGNISVRISPDTLLRLQSLKRSRNDSYTKLLFDAIVLYDSKL